MPEKSRWRLLAVALLGLIDSYWTAWADDGAATTPTEPLPTILVGADESHDALTRDARSPVEEIIVTATKRETPLREIPASIEYFDGQTLEARGQLQLPDFLETRPGVTQASISPGITRISIRGISTDAFPLSTLPTATGIFIGDTLFSDTYLANIQPDLSAFDLASVEVLKGPQGTLFGGSALAGAVRYVLREPQMGRWQSKGFAHYVDAAHGGQSWSGGAVLNAPLLDERAAVRLGYVRRGHPGVYDIDREPRREDVDEGQGEQLRGIVSWQPAPALKLKLTHLSQNYTTPDTSATADTRDVRQNDKRVMPQPTSHRFALNSLEMRYDFSNLRLISNFSLNEKDWRAFGDATAAVIGPPPDGYDPTLGAFQDFFEQADTASQELRLESVGDGAVHWLVGVFGYQSDLFAEFLQDTIAHRELWEPLTDSVLNSGYRESTLLFAQTRAKASEHALFVDLARELGPQLTLALGARLYRTQVRGGIYRTGVVPRAQNNGQDVNFQDNDITESGVNPKLSATWQFNQARSLYLAASRGYRFGGLQSAASSESNGVPPVYASDSIWNYELGLRSRWFGNRLQLDGTLFYIDYRDPQIGLRTTDPGVAISYVDNIGSAVSRGLEASLRWQTPLPGLALDIGGGLTDARTTEDFTAPGNVLVEAGAQLPGSARSQYMIELAYAAPQPARLGIEALASYSYVGKGYADITQVHAINDYATLDLHLGLALAGWPGRPRLGFKLTNALDASAAKFAATTRPTTGSEFDYFVLNPPRTLSMRLDFAF